EDLDPARRTVDPDPVAGRDALRRDGGPDDCRDPELAGEDGRVRRRSAGVGHEPGDLREEDDPCRVRHLADEDVAVLDLAELIDREHDPGGPLQDPGRTRDPGDGRSILALLAVEAIR